MFGAVTVGLAPATVIETVGLFLGYVQLMAPTVNGEIALFGEASVGPVLVALGLAVVFY